MPTFAATRRFAVWSILALGAGVAAGQTSLPAAGSGAPPPVAATSSTSLWNVVWTGLEWPGFLILAGSVTILTLIVEHFITVRRATIAPVEQVRRARELIERRSLSDCFNAMRQSSTFFAQVMTASLQHARHGFEAMHAAALEKSGELSGRLFRKVEYMNILGNLGPLLGLLGTVLGMIVAFAGLGSAGGQAGADAGALARGISLALVNTLLGLALAIIGVGFFGVCRNRVDALTVQATVQALDLLEFFRSSPAVGSPPRGAGSAALPSRPS